MPVTAFNSSCTVRTYCSTSKITPQHALSQHGHSIFYFPVRMYVRCTGTVFCFHILFRSSGRLKGGKLFNVQNNIFLDENTCLYGIGDHASCACMACCSTHRSRFLRTGTGTGTLEFGACVGESTSLLPKTKSKQAQHKIYCIIRRTYSTPPYGTYLYTLSWQQDRQQTHHLLVLTIDTSHQVKSQSTRGDHPSFFFFRSK